MRSMTRLNNKKLLKRRSTFIAHFSPESSNEYRSELFFCDFPIFSLKVNPQKKEKLVSTTSGSRYTVRLEQTHKTEPNQPQLSNASPLFEERQ